MRLCSLLLIIPFFAFQLYSQIVSNVRTDIKNGRIIITYDLGSDDDARYNISVKATNDKGNILTPVSIVGDLTAVAPGLGRSIWWEPQLEGLAPAGWKITLSAQRGFGIPWVLVEGGPGGDFYIAATEVTFDQYDKFCEATGYKKPSADFGRGKQPVIYVNVSDAIAYCNWVSKETGTTVRLPKDEEWEYAARGGKKSNGYEYSGSNNIDEVAWYIDNSGSKTHEVATKRANELGIYDMSGNVWEWCGTSGALHGGSWFRYALHCRVSPRYGLEPDTRSSSGGFRVLQKK